MSLSSYNVEKKEVSDNVYKGDGYSRWYDADEGMVYRDLVPFVRALEQRQVYRRGRNLEHAARYMNYEMVGTSPVLMNRRQRTTPPGRVAYNIIQSCVDTVTNQACADLPKPTLLTDDGDWSEQQRAKRLTAYVDGVLDDCDFDSLMQRSIQHSGVFGTGLVKLYIDADAEKIDAEHVLTDEVLVDDSDGILMKPRCIYQRRFVHRSELTSRFPKQRDVIRKASVGIPGEVIDMAMDDMVRCVEAWCLPSAPGKEDGRHVLVVEGGDLVDEVWQFDWHPFIVTRWGERLGGFWGFGIAEQLAGIQTELNKVIRYIQENIEITAAARMAIEASSRVNPTHINNKAGSLIPYVGTPPIPLNWNALNPEVYQWKEDLWNKGFAIVGVNQLASHGEKPAGVDSAVGMRTIHDLGSARFVVFGKRIEKAYTDAARIIIDLSKKLYSGSDMVRLSNRDGRFIRTVPWKEVDMEADRFKLKVYAVSGLPKTPAGRLSAVQDLVQAGIFDKDQALALLDFPDVQAATDMNPNVASFNLTMKMIEQMLEHNKYEPPSPYMNLTLARAMVQGALIRAKMQNAPEERLDNLVQFVAACTDELAKLNAPATNALPAAAPANPMPTPQSALIPNVNMAA